MTWPSNMTLLDQVTVPSDLRALPKKDLPQLADELRKETIDAVSVTGGHLGAGLEEGDVAGWPEAELVEGLEEQVPLHLALADVEVLVHPDRVAGWVGDALLAARDDDGSVGILLCLNGG